MYLIHKKLAFHLKNLIIVVVKMQKKLMQKKKSMNLIKLHVMTGFSKLASSKI